MVTSTTPPNWDPSRPAPGPLEVIRRFVNTLDVYRARDSLADREQAEAVLRGLGLLRDEERLSARDLTRIRELRGAIRSHFVTEDSGQVRDICDVELRLIIGVRGTVEVVATEDSLWGRLCGMCMELYVAERTGQLTRLKACANPGCRWLFWDASRPGTGRWCSMRVCSGQHKARAYRMRRQGTG
jgi:predicted RNA-binding Zn ribbon-like protein